MFKAPVLQLSFLLNCRPGRFRGVAERGLRGHLRPGLLLPDGGRGVVGGPLRRLVPLRGEGVVPRGDQQVEWK